MSGETETGKAEPARAEGISAVIRRIHEHKMVQWTIAYAALAYGVQHAVTLTSEALEWPHPVERITLILLALGVPLMLTVAWYHGAKASQRVSGPELTIISLLMVGISILFYEFARPSPESATSEPIKGASIATAVPSPPAGGTSLAVLPFANVSGERNQEFFSDGMTDEIMTALANVPALRVVGRESAFQFKGAKKDDRTIGSALGARYLVEGAVRKAGDRVRITAQLVRANDGVSLWTQAYDRDLKDVFAVQENIAQAIAASLQVPLGLKQGESLVANRTGDLEAYQEYLRARALYHGRALDQAITVLESVVQRDPNFAPAWGVLSIAYGLTPFYTPALRNDPVDQARMEVQAYLDKGEMAARKALAIDSRSALGYAGLGHIEELRFRWADAEDHFKEALELDPTDPDVLHHYSIMLADSGRLKAALGVREQLRALEPFVPVYNTITAGIMEMNGRGGDAIALLEPISPEEAPSLFRDFILARAYAARGQFEKSADAILQFKGDSVSPRSVSDAARLIRAPKLSATPGELPVLQGELGFVYTYIGAANRLLDFSDRQLAIGFGSVQRDTIWIPAASLLRTTQRFKNIVRKMGLVDYWKSRGWPDLCHPTTGDDFVCE